MRENKKVNHVYRYEQENTVWRSMVVFLFYIMLTALSLWGLFYTDYAPKPLLSIIAILAFVQALMQLFKVQDHS